MSIPAEPKIYNIGLCGHGRLIIQSRWRKTNHQHRIAHKYPRIERSPDYEGDLAGLFLRPSTVLA